MVARSADEQVWLDIAEVASGAQLRRICREFHKTLVDEEPLEASRGVDFSQRLDGLVTITARLLPAEAEIVSAALERFLGEVERDRGFDARDADAFVEAFRRALAAEPEAEPVARLIVHLDERQGVAHGRFRMSLDAARELGCDGEVQVQTERDGVPIDLGRARRVVSPQLSRALRARDGGCVFPACGRKKVHAHHIEHWVDGGRTDLRNLLSLCSFHHHQLHRGAFRVTGIPGRLRFRTRDGTPIGAAPQPARGHPPRPVGNPAALNYTPRLQFRQAIDLIADSLSFARARSPVVVAEAPP